MKFFWYYLTYCYYFETLVNGVPTLMSALHGLHFPMRKIKRGDTNEADTLARSTRNHGTYSMTSSTALSYTYRSIQKSELDFSKLELGLYFYDSNDYFQAYHKGTESSVLHV